MDAIFVFLSSILISRVKMSLTLRKFIIFQILRFTEQNSTVNYILLAFCWVISSNFKTS